MVKKSHWTCFLVQVCVLMQLQDHFKNSSLLMCTRKLLIKYSSETQCLAFKPLCCEKDHGDLSASFIQNIANLSQLKSLHECSCLQLQYHTMWCSIKIIKVTKCSLRWIAQASLCKLIFRLCVNNSHFEVQRQSELVVFLLIGSEVMKSMCGLYRL